LPLTLLVSVALLLSVLGGCAARANQSQDLPNDPRAVAGVWPGIWHGLIAPFMFVGSLFNSNPTVFEGHNKPARYHLGYRFGLASCGGGSGNRTARRN